MEQFLNISFIILSVVFGITFFGFAITSHKEKEKRARKIAILLAVGDSTLWRFPASALWMDDLFYGRKPAQRPAPEWTQVP